jgi:hypothetical protein
MFGYVRPVRDELKCKEFDLYRATYCGLCRTLRQRYGLLAPMFLNYDFTFLALLLTEEQEPFTPCRGRCHANPLTRVTMCQSSPALELAADESMILTYWKLRDGVQDEGFFKGIPIRFLSWLLRPAYRKAVERCPAFDRTVVQLLEELRHLEAECCPSIDRTADTFARLLQAAAPDTGDVARDRPMQLLLYHLGRWIYLIDARDDFAQDSNTGAYNPLLYRFGPKGDDDALVNTLEQSMNMMRSGFWMLNFGCRTPVIENILYLGLPLVQRCVFDGSWAKMKKQKIWRTTT